MDIERLELLDRPTDGARTAAVLLQVAQLAVAFAVLDRSGADPGRIGLLVVFAGVLSARVGFRLFRSFTPAFAWRDAIVTTLASSGYLVGFAVLGARENVPVSSIDAGAFALYASGALLSTGSESFRTAHQLARAPALDALCTTGPYAIVRHPKYVGDLAWASGWALATRASAAWIIVLLHAAILVFVYIPALERRLAGRYGAAYAAWAQRTARLIPHVF